MSEQRIKAKLTATHLVLHIPRLDHPRPTRDGYSRCIAETPSYRTPTDVTINGLPVEVNVSAFVRYKPKRSAAKAARSPNDGAGISE